MPARKWRSQILAYFEDKIVMVSGHHREYPDRFYFPTDVDRTADLDSVATACRILRAQSGINLMPSSVSLSREIVEKSVPLRIYTAEISAGQATWFRSHSGDVTATFVAVETILCQPKIYSNRTKKILMLSNLKKILSVAAPHALSEHAGVCQGGCGTTFSTSSRGDSCPQCGSSAAY